VAVAIVVAVAKHALFGVLELKGIHARRAPVLSREDRGASSWNHVMETPDVPRSTLRVLASLLVLAFEVARDHAATAVERIRPLVEPPDDLRVSSRIGALYSGLVVLDRGDIIAGIVVQTGQGIPQPAGLITPSPTPTTTALAVQRHHRPVRGVAKVGCRGWAEDPARRR
jgi:hypothetical protein